MKEIKDFIEIYRNRVEKSGLILEDEQVLPSDEVLYKVFGMLLNASCLRDELRFSTFRVCFLKDDSDFLESYIYAHSLQFEKPIPFTVGGLNKLAPAINPTMSYLCLDTSKEPYMLTGIIAAFTAWEQAVKGESSDGNRMPLVPNFYVKGPGEIDACFGEKTIVSYTFGKSELSRSDVFVNGYIAEELKTDSQVPAQESVNFLTRVLWQVDKYRHGGTIIIVPENGDWHKYLAVKYKLPCNYLFEDDKSMIDVSDKARGKEMSSYCTFISKLTTVDGAVVMTKDLKLIGFGAEILTDKMGKNIPPMKFLDSDDTVDTSKKFNDNGTRHRSGYRFAYVVDHSIVLICSQDGVMKAVTKHDDEVVVYNNISFSRD